MTFLNVLLLFADPIFPALNFAGCYVNGQILAHGDHWREDDCTFCQCVSGEARCVAAACGHSCLNPVTVPGECCPVCEGKDTLYVSVLSSILPAFRVFVVRNVSACRSTCAYVGLHL